MFRITPRRWAPAESQRVAFSLAWIDFSPGCTRTQISEIRSTEGITVEDVELALYLSEMAPAAAFSVTLSPGALPEPAYLDVYGEGMGLYGPLYEAFVRVPIRGRTMMGHDLAIRDLGVVGTLTPGKPVTITGIAENMGSFGEERILAIYWKSR